MVALKSFNPPPSVRTGETACISLTAARCSSFNPPPSVRTGETSSDRPVA